MKEKQIIGIDVSKKTLDVFIRPKDEVLKITNDQNGFDQLRSRLDPTLQPVVVMEHTGRYSLQLEQYLQRYAISYCKIAALEIKRSIGLVRGKTDRIDAVRIAEYGWLRRDQLKMTAPSSENFLNLENLLSLRSKLIRDGAAYKSRMKELVVTGCCKKTDLLYKAQQSVLKSLTVQIKKIEAAILDVIENDAELKTNFDLIRSIKGVGMIIAAKLITVTANFKKFADARKFNCYAGLAPFAHQSGSSIKGRARVSHLANKEIKTLLTLAAFAAVRHNPELKTYYQQRVSEGKRKMSCLNIIRAKIVSRVFAVIKRQTLYEQLLKAA